VAGRRSSSPPILIQSFRKALPSTFGARAIPSPHLELVTTQPT
jgi:hypothetical protein